MQSTEGVPMSHSTRAATLWAGLILAVVVLVALAASGRAAENLLVVDADGDLSLVDRATGEAAYTVPGAVATPDGSALLTTRTANLETRDPTTGEVTGTTSLPAADLAIRTVSPAGGAVALLPRSTAGTLYTPQPRTRTALTVAFTDGRPALEFDLPGNVEPEMFSLDEDTLFVLDFEPPEAPTGYSVRRLDLSTGALSDTTSPHVGVEPKMQGSARAQVLHPDGTFLYTLYSLPASAASDEGAEAAEHASFVHVIDLTEEWSHCIFLPAPVAGDLQAAVGMGIAPDGSELLVADAGSGTLTRIDTETLAAGEPRHVEQLRRGPVDVAIAPDGHVYVTSGEVVIGLASADGPAVEAWWANHPVSSVAVSGEELHVARAGSITVLDRATGREVAVIRAPGEDGLDLLGPPRGTVLQFPVVCAC